MNLSEIDDYIVYLEAVVEARYIAHLRLSVFLFSCIKERNKNAFIILIKALTFITSGSCSFRSQMGDLFAVASFVIHVYYGEKTRCHHSNQVVFFLQMGGQSNGNWTPTKRRGPIAAEFSSPGPAAIALKSSIGEWFVDVRCP